MGVKVTKDRVAAVLAGVRALTTQQVMVGIPSKTAERTEDNGTAAPETVNNAAIGYIHETGDPDRNLPARPFLVPGMRTIQDEAISRMKNGGEAALDSRTPEEAKARVNRILNIVGLMAQNAVRRKITEGPFAPLSPRTLAERRARGRTGTKPLIDTGQLRNAITYVLRKKGK